MPSYVRGDSNFDTASAEKLTLMTAQNSTSGTSIDFTGIPSWAKRITIMFNGVSTNGTSPIQVRLGSGSIQSTGYLGAIISEEGNSRNTLSSGFQIVAVSNAAAAVWHGIFEFLSISGNTIVGSGDFYDQQAAGSGAGQHCGGSVTLSGTLDRIRITTVNGTDTFDAGSINVMYEG